LPSNYRTKSQFNKSDYTKDNKLSTGGDRFYNKEGILPDITNIKYIEADIDYTGGGRNAKRIVYSADPLLIFYTSDHYLSYSIMKVVE
jgi:guanyl-specific ribonuclease Sa